MSTCGRPRSGWYCKRPRGHYGPCPVRARWWVLLIHKTTGKWF